MTLIRSVIANFISIEELTVQQTTKMVVSTKATQLTMVMVSLKPSNQHIVPTYANQLE